MMIDYFAAFAMCAVIAGIVAWFFPIGWFWAFILFLVLCKV